MDKKTVGAWIVHHSKKIEGVSLPTQDYEQIHFAGKCGILLNVLARSEESTIGTNQVEILAKSNGISPRLELDSILKELEKQRLIDNGEEELCILALTPAETLSNIAKIFEESRPGSHEIAALTLSEKASYLPIIGKDAKEFISDTYHIPSQELAERFQQYEDIGFVDSEVVNEHEIYFNGNLFRHQEMKKTDAILSSLTLNEKRSVVDLTQQLDAAGCMSKEDVLRVINELLYSKLSAIGFIDENSIGNESGTYQFVTRPSAFTKFTDSVADDAFDLAKAFVTSLTYGMISSTQNRGKIRMIEALLGKLIAGNWVGPATAIGQDYAALEMKGVVQVRPAEYGRFYMKLLKIEVGQLALAVIKEGEANTLSLFELPSVSATIYRGPEYNRTILRKQQPRPVKQAVANILNTIRTGGLK